MGLIKIAHVWNFSLRRAPARARPARRRDTPAPFPAHGVWPFVQDKAENVMLGVRHEKEGKLRVTYSGWDDAKTVLDGQAFELSGPPGRPRGASIPSPLRAT